MVGFEDIELNSYALGLLYKEDLVKLDQEKTIDLAPKVSSVPLCRFLGEHKKRISIFVNYADAAFIPDSQLLFLTKILEACKLNVGDVAIFNIQTPDFRFELVLNEMKPSYVISFGITPLALGLPMDFEKYKIMRYDSITLLCGHTLEEMSLDHADSKALKVKLWNALKQLFSI